MLKPPEGSLKLGHELGCNLLVHVEPRVGNADLHSLSARVLWAQKTNLARVPLDRKGRRGDSLSDIGVLEDDRGGLASQLQRDRLEV